MKKIILSLSIIALLSFDNRTHRASYYGSKFQGKPTASGQPFDMNAMTAAHKTLPFGTKVKITNVKNNKSVIVTINDRGPFIQGRSFDLSRGAFEKISKLERGVIEVKAERL